MWPRTELVEFLDLTSLESICDVEIGPHTRRIAELSRDSAIPFSQGAQAIASSSGIDLLDLRKSRAEMGAMQRELRLEALWRRVKAHPIFRRIDSDPNFRDCKRHFEAFRKSGRSQDMLGGRYVELRLLNVVAAVVGMQSIAPRFVPTCPTRAVARKAIGYARKLQSSMKEGIGLPSREETDRLRRLLDGLMSELQVVLLPGSKRRPRVDETASERYYLDLLEKKLRMEFGAIPPEIVANVGAMMGYDFDDSTWRRRSKAAKR